MKKFELKSNGIPLFCDEVKDLPAKKGTGFDSWYVICNFEADGKQYGFEWHQQSMFDKFITVETLLMDADRKLWLNHAATEPITDTSGASYTDLNVYSSFGRLDGTRDEMHLRLDVGDGQVDVVVRPTSDVLYNGTTGLLKFLGGGDSYEYAYFNMAIEGTVTIQAKTIEITNATAWFDRQWGFTQEANEVYEGSGMNKLSWLWLGLPLGSDRKEALSLWDAYGKDGRFNFATVYHRDGTQINLPASVEYIDIWKSQQSGNEYPRKVAVHVPLDQIDLMLEFVSDNPEFYREDGSINGCQSLCHVTGTCHGQHVDTYNILEIIGDLCGDI